MGSKISIFIYLYVPNRERNLAGSGSYAPCYMVGCLLYFFGKFYETKSPDWMRPLGPNTAPHILPAKPENKLN